MTKKLEDYLAYGGYKNEVFFGYFYVKNSPNSPRNGHGKSRLPYQIRHLHPGSNPQVALARLELLDFQEAQFYHLKTTEDFLSRHLKDPVFEPPKQKKPAPLPINSLGILFEIEFEMLARRCRKSRKH